MLFGGKLRCNGYIEKVNKFHAKDIITILPSFASQSCCSLPRLFCRRTSFPGPRRSTKHHHHHRHHYPHHHHHHHPHQYQNIQEKSLKCKRKVKEFSKAIFGKKIWQLWNFISTLLGRKRKKDKNKEKLFFGAINVCRSIDFK